jgi:hypothetical protein
MVELGRILQSLFFQHQTLLFQVKAEIMQNYARGKKGSTHAEANYIKMRPMDKRLFWREIKSPKAMIKN